MAITLGFLQRWIDTVKGKGAGVRFLSPAEAANLAGRTWETMHPWNVLVRPFTYASFREEIVLSGASWTQSGSVVTAAGTELDDYSFVQGDHLQVASGTGLTAGRFAIASKPTSSTLTITGDLGPDAADLEATVVPSSVALPANFREIVAINATNGLVQTMQQVDPQVLMSLRTQAILQTNWQVFYSLMVGDDGRTNLHIWPTQTAGTVNGVSLLLRVGWADVGDSDDAITQLPEWMEPLYMEVFRATIEGWDKREKYGSWSKTIAEVAAGPIFAAARNRDARLFRWSGGPQRGGATQTRGSGSLLWHSVLGSTVPPPS